MNDGGSEVVAGDITVLFVDDYAEYAEAGAEYLEIVDDAITVLPETRAESALERLSSDQVDCVVCDYEMPEMSGLEFLEAARRKQLGVPFVLLTGHETGRLESSVVEGETHVIQKGSGTHTFEELRSKIREIATAESGFSVDDVTG